MTSRRKFLSDATAGAAAVGLISTVPISVARAAQDASRVEPQSQQASERRRLIAEANFGRKPKAVGRKGMAITSHPLATRAAVDVMKAGGNACDAALCASVVQTVVEPHMTGITGVIATLYYNAATKKTMYVSGGANVPLSATVGQGGIARGPGVPGFWGGFEESLKRFGSKPRKELVAPAILYARDGFETHPFLWGEIFLECVGIGRNEVARAIYMPNKNIPRPGDVLYQKQAAETLERLAEQGNDYYYRGEFAREYCRVSQAGGRNITMADMERYAATFHEPVWGTYREFRIAGGRPPEDGGAIMIEVLNVLEHMDIRRWGPPSESPNTLHRLIQALNIVRRESFGHRDDAPVAELERALSKEVGRMRYEKLMNGDQHSNIPMPPEAVGSCEVTVADRAGNVCTILHTSNSLPFSTGLWASGVLICNLGGNGIPGGRPQRAILPNIIFKNDKPALVSGSPSVSLVQNVLQNSVNIMDFNMPIDQSVERPRFGSPSGVGSGGAAPAGGGGRGGAAGGRAGGAGGGAPAEPLVGIEADLDAKVRAEVEKRGVRFDIANPWNWNMGSFEGIAIDAAGTMTGCGDPRRNSKAEAV